MAQRPEPQPAIGAVAGMAGAVLALELAFTRITAAVLQFQFTFIVITLGVTGLGLGALLAAGPHGGRSRRLTGLAFAPVTLAVIEALPVVVRLQAGRFWVTGLVLVPPFVLAGHFLTATFRAGARRVGVLYATDLAGAATGSLLAGAAMNAVGPVSTARLAAVVGGASALPYVREFATRRGRRTAGAFTAALFPLLLAPAPAVPAASFSGPPGHGPGRSGRGRVAGGGRAAVPDCTAGAGPVHRPGRRTGPAPRHRHRGPSGRRRGRESQHSQGAPRLRCLQRQDRRVPRRHVDGRRCPALRRAHRPPLRPRLLGSGVGAASMVLPESHFSTRQGFEAVWRELAPEGRLALVFHNPAYAYRALATAAAFLGASAGFSDADVLARAVLLYGDDDPYRVLLIMQKQPVSTTTAVRIAGLAAQLGLRTVHLPPQRAGGLGRVLGGEITLTQHLTAVDRSVDVQSREVATDDRPYFLDLDLQVPGALIALLLTGLACRLHRC